jgi:hypothetical protein
MHSQTTSTEKQRVKVLVNKVGDTLVQTTLLDTKIILADLLEKENCDSLVFRYHKLNVLNKKTIDLQDRKIITLETKYLEQYKISTNLETMVGNKNKEIELLNDTIKQQNSKITKLKLFKIIGIPAVIAVPILTTLLVLK